MNIEQLKKWIIDRVGKSPILPNKINQHRARGFLLVVNTQGDLSALMHRDHSGTLITDRIYFEIKDSDGEVVHFAGALLHGRDYGPMQLFFYDSTFHVQP